MIPRSLAGRIVVAFVGLAMATLVAVGATLFVVLLQLHERSNADGLSREVASAIVTLRGTPPASWPAELQDAGAGLIDQGGYVMLVNRDAGTVLAGSPGAVPVPPMPGASSQTASGRLTAGDGTKYVYLVFRRDASAQRAVVFAAPDRSSGQAATDLAGALPGVIVALLLVGAPIAWLLSRSVTAPIRRLARATADLPGADRPVAPLPVEGPAEVQALTEHFNEMSAALGGLRERERATLSSLRHDLRTPLTSIVGFAEAIADGTVQGGAAADAARTIVEESARLERLVSELGVIERLREGPAALRPETLEPGPLIEAAGARFRARAGGLGISIETVQPNGRPASSFAADHLAVDRILQNLVENALAALRTGGHVWLAASDARIEGRGRGVLLSVTDDGAGFPPGTRERVFERFFRADSARSGSGSGLGLAIVRELAQAHGGWAWAENVAPHGARVSVYLPASPLSPPLPAHEPPPAVADAAAAAAAALEPAPVPARPAGLRPAGPGDRPG